MPILTYYNSDFVPRRITTTIPLGPRTETRVGRGQLAIILESYELLQLSYSSDIRRESCRGSAPEITTYCLSSMMLRASILIGFIAEIQAEPSN